MFSATDFKDFDALLPVDDFPFAFKMAADLHASFSAQPANDSIGIPSGLRPDNGDILWSACPNPLPISLPLCGLVTPLAYSPPKLKRNNSVFSLDVEEEHPTTNKKQRTCNHTHGGDAKRSRTYVRRPGPEVRTYVLRFGPIFRINSSTSFHLRLMICIPR